MKATECYETFKLYMVYFYDLDGSRNSVCNFVINDPSIKLYLNEKGKAVFQRSVDEYAGRHIKFFIVEKMWVRCSPHLTKHLKVYPLDFV